MKKLILPFSIALLALAGIATKLPAEQYDPRIDVSRHAADEARMYRGDQNWNGNDARAEADLDRLNHEVRRVRILIGDSRLVTQNIRDRYRRAKERAESLKSQYRRGNLRSWEVHRRAEQIWHELDSIRRDLRGRNIGIGGWR